jgi:hypothetical protein
MPKGKKGLTARNKMRDIAYMKPKGYENHVTLLECARLVNRDPSWLRRLEKADRIPKAKRVPLGKTMIRLWSPLQVNEIRDIISKLHPGRPRKS